jgi:hypothetical protein
MDFRAKEKVVSRLMDKTTSRTRIMEFLMVNVFMGAASP